MLRRTEGEVRTAGGREGEEGQKHSLRPETRFSE